MDIMKSILHLLMLVALIASASAHSLYAEFPEKLSSGTESDIWIAYGHGGTADSVLLDLPVAKAILPDGGKVDLELEPYQGGLKGTVPLDEPGCYILDLQMETSFFDPAWFVSAGSKSLVEKYGRALLPAESGEGFGWSSGEGLEIVPTVDPYGLKTGDQFSARALWNGKPVGGSYSAVVTRLPEDVLVIQHAQETVVEGSTDDGLISFTLTEPGLWVLSFEATLDERGTWTAEEDDSQGHYRKGDELQYEQIAPTAYLTFWVGK
jgi:hypothetical protein